MCLTCAKSSTLLCGAVVLRACSVLPCFSTQDFTGEVITMTIGKYHWNAPAHIATYSCVRVQRRHAATYAQG